jgi:hypothetical protein
MRIEILDLAKADLLEGFQFYEEKELGLGDYFLTNLFSDIERLKISAGIHRQAHRGFIVLCPTDSRLRSTTLLRITRYGFDPLLIAGDVLHGFERISKMPSLTSS